MSPIIKTQCLCYTKEGEIVYQLSRSTKRKRLVIAVDQKAQVCVAAPSRMPQKSIDDFIRTNFHWITKKVEEVNKNIRYLKQRELDEGHSFLFLGQKYIIGVEQCDIKRAKVEFDGSQWHVSVPFGLSPQERQKHIKKKMIQWYRKQAEEILGVRVFHYARIMNVAPKKIAVRAQKRIWGCCDYNTRTIHLNWQIILSPLDVIDYVVIHELSHLTHPNHSKRFWNRVEQFMPDYDRYRKWLKENTLDMVLP